MPYSTPNLIFFRLPRELRDEIYRLLLPTNCRFMLRAPGSPGLHHRSQFPAALLSTSKQISHEAQDILLKEITIALLHDHAFYSTALIPPKEQLLRATRIFISNPSECVGHRETIALLVEHTELRTLDIQIDMELEDYIVCVREAYKVNIYIRFRRLVTFFL